MVKKSISGTCILLSLKWAAVIESISSVNGIKFMQRFSGMYFSWPKLLVEFTKNDLKCSKNDLKCTKNDLKCTKNDLKCNQYILYGRKPPIGVNVSVALRQVYQRYLIAYERANTSNLNLEMVDEDDDGHDTMNKSSFLKDLSSTSLNTSMNSALNTSTLMNSSMIYQPGIGFMNQSMMTSSESFVNPLNKLYCSLVSGLPNEVEFGLKVTSMLANSKQIDWISDYKFIEVLLESCALYLCTCYKEQSNGGNSLETRREDGGNSLGTRREDGGNSLGTRGEDGGSSISMKVTSPYKRSGTPSKTRRRDEDMIESMSTKKRDEDMIESVSKSINHESSDSRVTALVDLVVSPSKIIETKRRLSSNTLSPFKGGKKWSHSDTRYTRSKCQCLQRFWNHVCDDHRVFSSVFDQPLHENDLQDECEIRNLCCTDLVHVSNCDLDQSKSKMKRIAVVIRAITEFMRESAIASNTDGDSVNLASSSLGLDPAPLSLVRFIALMVSSRDSSLTSLGLDIMSNVNLSSIDLKDKIDLKSRTDLDDEIDTIDTCESSRDHFPINSSEEKEEMNPYNVLSSYIYNRCIGFVLSSIDIDFVSKSLDILTTLNSVDDSSIIFFNHFLDQRVSYELIN